MSGTATAPMKKKDFVSDQEVRWCPGCGDYGILTAVQQVFAGLGIPRENFVFVSGIGCSSRFPYYMNTYGFHTIHGRAPCIATGIKLANPELSVWVATGDGDAMSIGGNHLIHAMRRNVDIKILLFNNKIYGLTKGQYSPTSEKGKRTVSTPYGSVDRPFNPISLALGSEATFVARTVDRTLPHMRSIFERAAAHRGSTFVEIFQNCNIFNDGAFEHVTDKATKTERQLLLEHDKPMLFDNGTKGIRMKGCGTPEVVTVEEGQTQDLLTHDEHREDPSLAFMLSRLDYPDYPVPLGIFRDVEVPTLEDEVNAQIQHETERLGEGTLKDLFSRGDTWNVNGKND